MILTMVCFIVTIGIYLGVKWGYTRKHKFYLSPILIVPAVLIIFLIWTGIPLTTYRSGTKVLIDLLEPATIAFAIPLYKYYEILKKYVLEITVSVLSGSMISIISTALMASWVHLNNLMVNSMIPRSITTPIAMGVSQSLGGNPSITAAIVMMTGLLGSSVGPLVIRKLHINNEISRGVMLGTSAHALGTSKAFELSSMTGAISSVSMILAAIFTLSITPWLTALFN